MFWFTINCVHSCQTFLFLYLPMDYYYFILFHWNRNRSSPSLFHLVVTCDRAYVTPNWLNVNVNPGIPEVFMLYFDRRKKLENNAISTSNLMFSRSRPIIKNFSGFWRVSHLARSCFYLTHALEGGACEWPKMGL